MIMHVKYDFVPETFWNKTGNHIINDVAGHVYMACMAQLLGLVNL